MQLLFFFYWYGEHPLLHVPTHSFPTRPSSDLLELVVPLFQHGFLAKLGGLVLHQLFPPRDDSPTSTLGAGPNHCQIRIFTVGVRLRIAQFLLEIGRAHV